MRSLGGGRVRKPVGKRRGVCRRESATRRSLRSPRSQSGLTMIEVLVSVVMVAILIVPIFDGFVMGRVLIARRAQKRMALRLVERKLEQLLDAGYGSSDDDADVSSVDLTAGTHPKDPSIVINTKGDNDPSNDVIGNLRWDVLPISSFGGEDIKIVDASLVWPSSSPRDSVTVSIIIGG
jgi:prepilin-type N-terminal cleavage/methylation domain-containing protein